MRLKQCQVNWSALRSAIKRLPLSVKIAELGSLVWLKTNLRNLSIYSFFKSRLTEQDSTQADGCLRAWKEECLYVCNQIYKNPWAWQVLKIIHEALSGFKNTACFRSEIASLERGHLIDEWMTTIDKLTRFQLVEWTINTTFCFSGQQ